MKKGFLVTLFLLMISILISCQQTIAYTVTFDTEGGSIVQSQEIKEDEFAEIPDTPLKDGYSFVEWQLNEQTYNFQQPVTSHITLVAVWEYLLFDNPVWEPVLADPSIIRYEGIYYAYGTQDDGVWGDEYGVKYGPIIQSTNLVDWTYTGSVFTGATRPGWGTLNAGIWAPDIVEIDGTFILYYSLSLWGDEDPGIGYATASHPAGPWTDQGKLFLSSEIGVNNSIDPAVFTGEDGKVYMIWGSFRGIYGIELASDGQSLSNDVTTASQNKVLLAGYETSQPFNMSTYEGAYVIYNDGYYYMFLSSGSCCNGANSTYHVVVGRSTNPLGPYVDHLGRSMQQSNVGYPVVDRGNSFSGVGHNSVTTDDAGEYWIVYHGYDLLEPDKVGNTNRRSLLIDHLIWQDGWPSVEGNISSNGTSEKPYIEE